MNSSQSYKSIHSLMMILSVAVLIISLFGSAHFGENFSDENGPVEMAQNIVLLIATTIATLFARKSEADERSFWLLAAGFFFVLFAREISWGAVLLPLLSPETYSTVPSSKVLWYRPAITPALVALFVVLIALFIKQRGWMMVPRLFNSGKLPIAEAILFTVAAILTTAAEEKMGLSLPFESHTNHNLEETAELAAYLFLLTAAIKIRMATRLEP